MEHQSVHIESIYRVYRVIVHMVTLNLLVITEILYEHLAVHIKNKRFCIVVLPH